ncbi:hypothetical protein SERLADRAFT_457509 [Serpula lacrymans var. lacrymans S7.9]|uniref:RecA family profile 1 domain-containing protein n=2 Tax=Serpula lacrymans var. lacrymans TaxID=341189 RepID=F8NJ85_SERL9|nr:uncharacterized protein SERLADRAFT_457509 [Serpula lacrymans var. lacrymans S7.9]EGO29569.1 hypothetical protein SERLADRAFT_457509 [Serpula lacrymans var. lacrymans S7.9]
MSRNSLLFASLPTTTRVALSRAGYESIVELSDASPDQLSEELGIPVSECQALVSTSKAPNPFINHSAADMSSKSHSILTCNFPCVNTILGGGLPRGSILEISGPPGCFKEKLAVDFVKKVIEAGEEVIFVDMQNMVNSATLQRILEESPTTPPDYKTLVRHTQLFTLPELIAFMHTLHLHITPNTRLLVLNSLSFPFQSPADMEHSKRKAILQRVRQFLLETSSSGNITIVTTTQLSTKVIDANGAPANFETGTTAIMVPQLGPTYLPAGLSYRLIIAYESRTTGFVRLLSSPSYQPEDGPAPQEPYEL